jgi:putative Mg2+ transporter-C (MgtC) family protein
MPSEMDLVLRLLVATVLGCLVGFEREFHGHPAGTRTHALVAFGSAAFTVMSAYGFAPPGEGIEHDPTRIAAQIVSGIGFLGAGAILRAGISVRGLTTAASLWATASIGLSVGAGSIVLAVLGTIIILFALAPLNAIIRRLPRHRRVPVRLRLTLPSAELPALVERLRREGFAIDTLDATADGETTITGSCDGGQRRAALVLLAVAASDGVRVSEFHFGVEADG